MIITWVPILYHVLPSIITWAGMLTTWAPTLFFSSFSINIFLPLFPSIFFYTTIILTKWAPMLLYWAPMLLSWVPVLLSCAAQYKTCAPTLFTSFLKSKNQKIKNHHSQSLTHSNQIIHIRPKSFASVP